MPNYSYHPEKLSPEDKSSIVQAYLVDTNETSVSLSTKYKCSAPLICNVLRASIPEDKYRRLKLLRNPSYQGEEASLRKQQRKDFFRQNRLKRDTLAIFSTPLSVASAYWIGFLLADGNVHGNRISLSLSVRDGEHVKKFMEFVDVDNPLMDVPKNRAVSYRFSSKQAVKDLACYDIIPNKSCRMPCPAPP